MEQMRVGIPQGEALHCHTATMATVSTKFDLHNRTYELYCTQLHPFAKSTLTTWICTQTVRYALSKNAAILANLANRGKKFAEGVGVNPLTDLFTGTCVGVGA